jgi:hypothetical protein
MKGYVEITSLSKYITLKVAVLMTIESGRVYFPEPEKII